MARTTNLATTMSSLRKVGKEERTVIQIVGALKFIGLKIWKLSHKVLLG